MSLPSLRKTAIIASMEHHLITRLPSSRWSEYKKLRIEALIDSPQAFLDTVAEAEERSDEEWIARSQNMMFLETDAHLFGMGGYYADQRNKKSHVAIIVSVYLKKEFRGHGYGKILMQAIIEEIKKQPQYRKIEIGVMGSQENALALYQKCGFRIAGKLTKTLKIDEKLYDEYLLEMLL